MRKRASTSFLYREEEPSTCLWPPSRVNAANGRGEGWGPLRQQWEGEGPPSEALLYSFQHRIKIAHQLLIAKAHDTISLRFQPHGSAAVAGQFFRCLVGHAVNLYYELCFRAAEVGEEWSNRNLPRKFYSVQLSIAQAGPEPRFRKRLFAAE
jgi:hypothetical protein